jgi:cytochrome c biogenesis protein CcmG/thiol:disulfide interchange protein DsbE
MIDQNILGEQQPVARRGFGLGSLLLLFGVALVAIIFGLQLIRQKQTQPTSGPAPDFSITTFSGETITLSEQRGKVVVINFWASWCVECRYEAAALQSIWQNYKDKDVLVLGVAYTDTETGALGFMAEFGQTYPNGMDLGTRISDKYHITGVPETFVIDQNGNVAELTIGNITEAGLTATIEQLLARTS